jgi:hypothetical protein
MLRDEGLARGLQGQIEPQDFTDPLFRRIAQRIFEALGTGGSFDSRMLFRDGEEELNNLISHYSVLDVEYEDPQKHCRDCVDLIKQQDPEKKMKALIKTIQEAEARGDADMIVRLIEEQNELGKRPGRKIPGK